MILYTILEQISKPRPQILALPLYSRLNCSLASRIQIKVVLKAGRIYKCEGNHIIPKFGSQFAMAAGSNEHILLSAHL